METNVTQLLHNFNYLVTISGAYLCHLGTGQEIAIFLYSHLLKMVVFVLTILEQNKWLFVRWRIFSCSMKVKWALKNFWKMVVFFARISWTRQMIVRKKKNGFIFCESEKSFEDFFLYKMTFPFSLKWALKTFFMCKKMIFRLTPPKQGKGLWQKKYYSIFSESRSSFEEIESKMKFNDF